VRVSRACEPSHIHAVVACANSMRVVFAPLTGAIRAAVAARGAERRRYYHDALWGKQSMGSRTAVRVSREPSVSATFG
jgi:hypothetical protein